MGNPSNQTLATAKNSRKKLRTKPMYYYPPWRGGGQPAELPLKPFATWLPREGALSSQFDGKLEI